MAMIKLAQPITDIEGKFGGDIFRTDQCGPHVQAYPRLVHKEPTTPQAIRRRAFRECWSYIKLIHQPDQINAWKNYAKQHPIKSKKRDYNIALWQMAFISVNINRLIAGDPVLMEPPN